MTRSHFRALVFALVCIALVAWAAPGSAAQEGNPGKGLARGRAKGVVIVGYDAGTSAVKRGKAAKSVNAKSSRKVSPLAGNTYVLKLPPGQTVGEAIVELEKQDGVAYAEPDYFVHVADTSNDTYFDQMWGMQGDASTPSNQFGSGAAEAWAVGAIGSANVYVAVLDQGVRTDHEDLAPNMDVTRGWDFLSDDADVYDGSAYWHGTHVAGTIGARGGNGIGVAGVNWRVKLISVKMLGLPSAVSGAISNTVAAIDYVTALKSGGLNIVAINASWGYEGPSSTPLYEAILRAGDAGILFVAAAGNEGNDIDRVNKRFYPAAYDCSTTSTGGPRGWDCLISVANLTQTGGIASDSNYGSTMVDLGAPGSNILSAHTSTYAWASGTSMAAPHVTGAVALCASLDASLSPAAIRDRILSTTTNTSSLSQTVTGGRLDIGAMATACGAPVAVPDLVGDHENTVAATLGSVGLAVGTRTSASHASIPAAHVISSDPVSGTLVAPGSSVDYVVSLGPPPVAVPDLSPPPAVVPRVATPRKVVADDLSRRFTRLGTGWRAANFGYAKHHFWAPTRAVSAKRVGKWKPTLAAPGAYRILAKMPKRHASTKRAVYRIKTTTSWVKRVRDQSKRQGRWLDLGVFRLTRLPVVKLTDRTGERTSRGRSVAFDAVKFIPVRTGTASPGVVSPPASELRSAPTSTTARKVAPKGQSTTRSEAEDAEPKQRRSAPSPGLERAEPPPQRKPVPSPETPAPAKTAPAAEPRRWSGPAKTIRPSPSAARRARPAGNGQPGRKPELQAAKPKPAAAPESGSKLKLPKRIAEQVKPLPAPLPEPRPEPELLLVIDPERLTLAVGESRRIAAFACPEGAASAGRDERYGSADDSCTPKRNIEWSLKDPAVASLVEETGDEHTKAVLSATSAIDSTEIIATAGELTAKSGLTIKPAGSAPEALGAREPQED